MASYRIDGFFSVEDVILMNPAWILIDVSSEEKAAKEVKRGLEKFLVVVTYKEDSEGGYKRINHFSKDPRILHWLNWGTEGIEKKDLPLYLGIDPFIDSQIANALKE